MIYPYTFRRCAQTFCFALTIGGGGGKSFSDDGSDGLFQDAFEGWLSQGDVGQLKLMLASCSFYFGLSSLSHASATG
jgi:hypothetical protein